MRGRPARRCSGPARRTSRTGRTAASGRRPSSTPSDGARVLAGSWPPPCGPVCPPSASTGVDRPPAGTRCRRRCRGRGDGVVRLGRAYLRDGTPTRTSPDARAPAPRSSARRRETGPAAAPRARRRVPAGLRARHSVAVDGWQLARYRSAGHRRRRARARDAVLVDADDVPQAPRYRATCASSAPARPGSRSRAALAAQGSHGAAARERQPSSPTNATQALYRGKDGRAAHSTPTRRPGLDGPRLRFFGGTTNHWSGYCRPFPEVDFEAAQLRAAFGVADRTGRRSTRTTPARTTSCSLGPYDYSVASWSAQGHLGLPFLDDPPPRPTP